MPETYKALIVIIFLSATTFWLSKKTLPKFLSVKEFNKWRNLWLSVIIVVFISPNIWLFSLIIFIASMILMPRNLSNRTPYYMLVLCAVPQLKATIPGALGINFIFHLTYPRLLVISLFFGLFINQYFVPFFTHKQNDSSYHFSLPSDKLVVLYVALVAYLNFRYNTITNGLREFSMLLLDIFIPYFMISRSAVTMEQMNRILLAILFGLMPLAVIGIFENVKHWNLYNTLSASLPGPAHRQYYDMRAGSLRSSGPFLSPIVFGYVLVVAFGLLLYLKPLLSNQKIANLAGLIIALCLLSTMARGPWVGLVILIIAYAFTGNSTVKHLSLFGIASVVGFTLLSVTTFGKKIIDLLPFIGTTRSDTIEYRERLIENALIVFEENPWLGSPNYRDTPEMESMRQGQGIIDIVNSYIHIVLSYGSIGLVIFLAIFLGLLYRCYKMIKKLPKREVDLIRLGRSLFATLVSILLIIFTASSYDYIPVFYWTLVGLTAAYLNICNITIKNSYKKRS